MTITEKLSDSSRTKISLPRLLQLWKRWKVSYIHVAERWMDTGHTKLWQTMTQPLLLPTLPFAVKQTFNLNQPILYHTLNILDCGYMNGDLPNQLLFSLSGRNLTLETSKCFLSRLGTLLEQGGRDWPTCLWDVTISFQRNGKLCLRTQGSS